MKPPKRWKEVIRKANRGLVGEEKREGKEMNDDSEDQMRRRKMKRN